MFELILSPAARAFFAAADPPLARKLARCFRQLEHDPRRHNNIKRLSGKLTGRLRYRVGDWSYPGRDVLGFQYSSGRQWTSSALGTNRGQCVITFFEMPDPERAAVERALGQDLGRRGFFYVRADSTRGPDGSRWWNALGFARETSSLITGFHARSTAVFFPMWLLVLITAAVPAAAGLLGHLHRRARSRRGCCTICGYDLRASKERCPECGTAIAAGGQAAA